MKPHKKRPMGRGAAVMHPRRTSIGNEVLIRLSLAIVCPMGRGSVTLAGCGAAPHKETMQVAATLRFRLNFANTKSPPKVAYPLEPPLADENKSDGSMPHLRAAAAIFADVQADERGLYRCDSAFR